MIFRRRFGELIDRQLDLFEQDNADLFERLEDAEDEYRRAGRADAEERFGDLQVFKGIDLTVGEREILTIVGPSGCGKTTLLRCIDGLLPYDEGEIRVEGNLVTDPPEGVAMVFQHFGLFPWKTVWDNVGSASSYPTCTTIANHRRRV